jgi:aqualysin 1
MRRAKRLIVVLPLLALALAFTGGVGAQRSELRIPVIGVFPEDGTMDLQAFRGAALMEDRFAGLEARHLRPEVVGAVQSLERLEGFQASHVYSAALNGFAAELTARQIDLLEERYGIQFEVDQIFHTQQAQTLPWGINRVDADISSTLAGNGSGSVTNVNIYVIDTGVGTHTDINRVNHLNFTGDGNNNDCNGHGTHVAGTIAARDNTTAVVGVVPGAPVTGVKVLGCNGSGATSQIVQGIDWVTANGRRPGVANMSLGGGVSTALDAAVRRSVAAGFVYALAAGNNAGNACNTSPARAGAGTNNGILTTASTTSTNAESSFSNFGSCVDVWAPGSSILSTRLGGGTTTMSGTSMASPHAAGVAALFLSRNTTASPATVEAQVKANMLGFGTTSKDGRAIRIVNARNF